MDFNALQEKFLSTSEIKILNQFHVTILTDQDFMLLKLHKVLNLHVFSIIESRMQTTQKHRDFIIV